MKYVFASESFYSFFITGANDCRFLKLHAFLFNVLNFLFSAKFRCRVPVKNRECSEKDVRFIKRIGLDMIWESNLCVS